MCIGKMILIIYIIGLFLSWIGVKVDEELNGFRGETDRYFGYIICILFWPITLVLLIIIGLHRVLRWTVEKIARRIALILGKNL